MANIISEKKEVRVAPAYYIKSGKIAFYEKIFEHFIKYDDDSCELTIIRKKISKKNYEKLKKLLDKSN